MPSRSRIFHALAAGLLWAGAPLHALIYTYENSTTGTLSNAATPCTNPLVRNFTVTDSFTVTEIAIGINLSHNNRGDIRAILFAPGGSNATAIALSTDSDNNYDVYITDFSETAAAIDDGDADPTGEPYYHRLVDNNTIDTFYTGNSAGTWSLQICDNVAATNGTFNRAQLTLFSSPGATTTCASRMTYDWGSNGNNTAFTNTTLSNVTLTQSATNDFGGAGFNNTTLPRYNFRTGTGTFSGHTGQYGFSPIMFPAGS